MTSSWLEQRRRTRNSYSSLTTRSAAGSTTRLNGVLRDFVDVLENIPEGTDLVFGAFIVFCAVTPYFLGLFFPDFFDETLFMKVYGENDAAGRRAEGNWKKLYSTQGLVLTTIQFLAYLGELGVEEALRYDYIAWFLFYVVATAKLAIEDRVMGIVAFNRIPSQVWHVTVALVLLGDLIISPNGVELISKTVVVG